MVLKSRSSLHRSVLVSVPRKTHLPATLRGIWFLWLRLESVQQKNWELIIRVEKKECRFALCAAVISSLVMPCQ